MVKKCRKYCNFCDWTLTLKGLTLSYSSEGSPALFFNLKGAKQPLLSAEGSHTLSENSQIQKKGAKLPLLSAEGCHTQLKLPLLSAEGCHTLLELTLLSAEGCHTLLEALF